MFDFPNSPTLNQTITGPGVIQYRWDGAKWVSGTTPSSYLPLTGGTVSGNLLVIGTATLPNAVAEPALNNVGRSYIHNGLFNIAQRGTAFTATGYTLDRWQLLFNLDTGVSVSQLAISDAVRSQIGDEAAANMLSVSFTGNAGAASYTEVTQAIEGVRRLAGKTIILSFWAVAGVAGLKLGINGYSYYGTGGSPSAPAGWAATGTVITLGAAW